MNVKQGLKELLDIVKRICHIIKTNSGKIEEWNEIWDSFKTEISQLEEKLGYR